MMNGDKIRPQILETPYKLQDICPTRKLRAPEDTLRRIQKKIAFTEKKRTLLALENNELARSTHTVNPSFGQGSLLSMEESLQETHGWISEFRRKYKGSDLAKEFETEWYSASDIFQQIAHAYSNS